MKRTVILIAAIFVMSLALGVTADAQVNNLNEPGSLLVFPLIDNINYSSIVEIANTHPTEDVWLWGYIIAHPPGEPDNFIKSDFRIYLTPKEVFWWQTCQPIPERGLQSFNNLKGFMFLWAVDQGTWLERDFDYLKGDSVMFGGPRAMQYNAIPHQVISINPNYQLFLNGGEYTMATSQILAEGFSAGFSGIQGTLAVCNLDIDFVRSSQPEFDINFFMWNENEIGKSVHQSFYQFVQYDIATDLQLGLGQVFTPKWHLATSSTDALWAVMLQYTGGLMWGTNVFQNPAYGAAAYIILPPPVN